MKAQDDATLEEIIIGLDELAEICSERADEYPYGEMLRDIQTGIDSLTKTRGENEQSNIPSV